MRNSRSGGGTGDNLSRILRPPSGPEPWCLSPGRRRGRSGQDQALSSRISSTALRSCRPATPRRPASARKRAVSFLKRNSDKPQIPSSFARSSNRAMDSPSRCDSSQVSHAGEGQFPMSIQSRSSRESRGRSLPLPQEEQLSAALTSCLDTIPPNDICGPW